jgi:hypothetical protein
MDCFKQALEDCNLHDLGFCGDPFTWRNNSSDANNYIRERLDRAVATPDWCDHFPLYRVVNGEQGHSDHRPIIIHLDDDQWGQQGRRRQAANFRFEASWIDEEMCKTVIENAWHREMAGGAHSVTEALKGVAGDLKHWSSTSLGDMEKRIARLKKEIDLCRRGEINQKSVNWEHILRYKLERLEEQRNTYWKHRSHVNWLAKGDRNTAFFHSYASERKKRIGSKVEKR